MRRALGLVALAALGACDLDTGGAFSEYCREHPGRCGSGGGRAGAGGSSAGGGSGGAAAGGGTGGAGAGDAGLTLDRWCEALAQANSDYAYRCGRSQAVTYYSSAMNFCDRADRPRAKKGYLRYDHVAAEACVASYATASCNDYLGVTCPRVMFSNSPLDGGCEGGDCTSGYCEFSARNTPGLACPTCLPLIPLGGACPPSSGPHPGCGPNAWCSNGADGGGTCVVRQNDGAACMSSFECASGTCTDYSQLDGGGRTCGFLPLGSPCVDQYLNGCAPTAYCAGLRFAQNGAQLLTIGVCTARFAPGAACADEQFDDGCPDGGSCLSGTCIASNTRQLGDTCDSPYECDRARCTRDFPYQPNGSPAIADGTCVGNLIVGAACSRTPECALGLWCESSQCAPVHPLGAPCNVINGGESCGPNVCRALADGGATCQGEVDGGLPCIDGANVCPNTMDCQSFDGGPKLCQRLPDGYACTGPPRCESLRCAAGFCAPSCFL